MSKIYKHDYVDIKIAELIGTYNENGVQTGLYDSVGYGKVCCNSNYSGATFVGCMLAFLQQATGINIFIFYSNTLFTNLSNEVSLFTTNFTSGMMGITDFIFSIVGCVMLGYFGRKTIMIYGNLIMAGSLVALGIFTLYGWTVFEFGAIMTFHMAFQASSGPITYLYMAEIMEDKGISIGNFIMCVSTFLVAAIFPFVAVNLDQATFGYIWMCTGCITGLGAFFVALFMQETKGLSLDQVK